MDIPERSGVSCTSLLAGIKSSMPFKLGLAVAGSMHSACSPVVCHEEELWVCICIFGTYLFVSLVAFTLVGHPILWILELSSNIGSQRWTLCAPTTLRIGADAPICLDVGVAFWCMMPSDGRLILPPGK